MFDDAGEGTAWFSGVTLESAAAIRRRTLRGRISLAARIKVWLRLFVVATALLGATARAGVLYEQTATGQQYSVTEPVVLDYGRYVSLPFWSGSGPIFPSSGGAELASDVRVIRLKRISGIACTQRVRFLLAANDGSQIVGPEGPGVAVGDLYCDYPVTGTSVGRKFWSLIICLNDGCTSTSGELVLDGSSANPGFTVDGYYGNPVKGGWAYQLCDAQGCTDFARAWQWPVGGTSTRTNLTQDFAEYQSITTKKTTSGRSNHHVGFDIGVGGESGIGTSVVAVRGGTVVRLQQNRVANKKTADKNVCNKPGLAGESGDCGDHGLGNTIVLQHVLGGITYYSQYQHLRDPSDPAKKSDGTSLAGPPFEETLLAQVKEKCGDYVRGVIDCEAKPEAERPRVTAGQVIGYVGRSGTQYSDSAVQNPYKPHLHFELKSFSGFAVLAPGKKPGKTGDHYEYGYTENVPTWYGYLDPSMRLDNVSGGFQRRIVELVAGDGPRLRYGPRKDYPGHLTLSRSASTSCATLTDPSCMRFISVGEAPPTDSCSKGWYQIVKLTRDVAKSEPPSTGLEADLYFKWTDTDPLYPSHSIYNPDGWVCRGDGTETWVREAQVNGDANGDGSIDRQDLAVIFSSLLAVSKNSKQFCSASVPTGINDTRDLDADMKVSLQDLHIAERLCSPNCSIGDQIRLNCK